MPLFLGKIFNFSFPFHVFRLFFWYFPYIIWKKESAFFQINFSMKMLPAVPYLSAVPDMVERILYAADNFRITLCGSISNSWYSRTFYRVDCGEIQSTGCRPVPAPLCPVGFPCNFIYLRNKGHRHRGGKCPQRPGGSLYRKPQKLL